MSARKPRRKVDEEQPYDIDDHLASSESTTSNSQRKQGNVLQIAFRHFEDYCAHSTIHGMQYLSEKKRHWTERCWWIIGFAISWWCCGELIYQIYSKWCNNAVIVSIAQELTPVWHIPFPAVTICPTTKVNITQFNITEALEKVFYPDRILDFSNEELKFMNAVSQICEPYR